MFYTPRYRRLSNLTIFGFGFSPLFLRGRYVQRKVRDEFHKNAGLSGEELAAALSKARADQSVIQRQVEVYRMFGSPVKSILDMKK
jgi:hypothetical protein